MAIPGGLDISVGALACVWGTLAVKVSDAIPTEIPDRAGTGLRLAGNVKTKTASMPTLEHADEDAPTTTSAGLVTSVQRVGEALADVGAAASRTAGRRHRATDRPPPRTLPVWVMAMVGLVTGSGGTVGARSLMGPDPQVVSLAARADAQDREQERQAKRIDATEDAIAAAEVSRVAEVRFLIDLSVQGFGQLGVSREDLPAVPAELAEQYRATEVEQTWRKLFKPAAVPAVPLDKPGTIPPP